MLVDGRRVDIPSFRVKVGHSISIREKSASVDPVIQGIALAETRRWDTPWMTVDAGTRACRSPAFRTRPPCRSRVDVQLVIELYALNA